LQKARKDLDDCNKINAILRGDIEKLRNR
jgi:hypothetical protein